MLSAVGVCVSRHVRRDVLTRSSSRGLRDIRPLKFYAQEAVVAEAVLGVTGGERAADSGLPGIIILAQLTATA